MASTSTPKAKSSFDKEAFINGIFQHEFIYNPTHPDYMNRDLSEKTFADLAEQFGLKDAAEAKTKWKSIKDSYRIQKKKIRDGARSGSGASASKVRWPFFEQCGFLDRFMTISKTCSNYSIDAVDSSDSDTPPPPQQLFPVDKHASPSPEAGAYCQFPGKNGAKKRRSSLESSLQQALDKTTANMNKLANREADDDSLYGSYIASRVKHLTKKEKHNFKISVENLLFSYETDNSGAEKNSKSIENPICETINLFDLLKD